MGARLRAQTNVSATMPVAEMFAVTQRAACVIGFDRVNSRSCAKVCP